MIATLIRTAIGASLILILAIVPAFSQATEGDDAPLRFGRVSFHGEVMFGFVSAGGFHQLDRSFLKEGAKLTGKVFPLDQVRVLAPVVPGKVIGIALNYKSHGGRRSGEISFFSKLPSSIIGTDDDIIAPPRSRNLHYEGEMVIVIGARAKKISVKKAEEVIFGVTIGNDVTERSYPFAPFDVLRMKGSDTFGPLGPWIVPGLSYDRLMLQTRLNGKVVQKSSTGKMLYKVAEIVSRVSAYVTLEPGDVIYTGTPGTTRAMKKGDVVEVMLEGVGTLKNTVGK